MVWDVATFGDTINSTYGYTSTASSNNNLIEEHYN